MVRPDDEANIGLGHALETILDRMAPPQTAIGRMQRRLLRVAGNQSASETVMEMALKMFASLDQNLTSGGQLAVSGGEIAKIESSGLNQVPNAVSFLYRMNASDQEIARQTTQGTKIKAMLQPPGSGNFGATFSLVEIPDLAMYVAIRTGSAQDSLAISLIKRRPNSRSPQ